MQNIRLTPAACWVSEAFKPEQAGLFFGRDQEINEIVEKIKSGEQKHRFLFITGASGSGKSSLIHAGVIPRLLDGDDNNPPWTYVRMMPGKYKNPFLSLASSLDARLEDVGERPEEFAEKL